MKKLKAVAFDAWGTLFDEAEDSLKETAAKIVKDMNITMTPKEFLNLWKRFYFEYRPSIFNIRRRNIITLDRTFETLNVKGDAEEYVNFLVDSRWANSRLYHEVSEVLQTITLPKCIISNIDNDTIQKALDKNNLTFEYIVTSENAKAYKPNPKIFLDALRLIRCNNDDVLFVGDSQRDDIAGAKNAGITTVWVNRRKERLEEGIPKPDYEIRDLKGLLKILDEL